MKKNTSVKILAFLCIVFLALQTKAQATQSKFPSSREILPVNRAAFLYCYNNSMSFKNPAEYVLSKESIKNNNTSISSNNSTELQKDDEICMFSNITEDELWVELKNSKIQNQNLELEIYNANGERVYNKRMEEHLHKINMCDFTAGTFLIKLGDDVQKLIIE